MVPNPFFDTAGIVAGGTRLPVRLFPLACLLGKAVRFRALASLGGSL